MSKKFGKILSKNLSSKDSKKILAKQFATDAIKTTLKSSRSN